MSNSSEWTTIKFGDLVEGHRGVSYQPCDLLDGYIEESVVLLRANNIQQGRLQFHDIQIVPKHLVKNTQYLSIGDVAVCMSNGSKHLVGKSAQLVDKNTFDCTIGAFCSVFRPKEGSDPTFVKQLFLSNSYQAHIDLSLAGSAINNLKNSDIESIIFKIPSKPRQKKIAAILGTIDRTITHTEALIEKYQQIKAGLMHDLFTRGIGADGKLRPPRDQAPEMYRESSIGWIPKNWKLKACQDIFIIDSGITLGAHRRPKNNPRPYLRVANVFKERITLNDVAYLEASDVENIKYGLNIGDLLLVEGHANIQQIGRCGLVEGNAEKMLFQNHLFRLKAVAIFPHFGMYLLNSHVARKYWETSCSTSSGLNTINRKMLGKMSFGIPPSDEQLEIEKKLLSISEFIANESNHLKKLLDKKSGLMNDLLTGKVQVNIDSAEAMSD